MEHLAWIVAVVGLLFLLTSTIAVMGLDVGSNENKRYVKVATVETFEPESLGDFFKSVSKSQLLRNCGNYDDKQCNQVAACVWCQDECLPGDTAGPTREKDIARCPEWKHLGKSRKSGQIR